MLLTGPEGGFSADEITLVEQNDFLSIKLGPRILRTETAPLAAISILQTRGGDYWLRPRLDTKPSWLNFFKDYWRITNNVLDFKARNTLHTNAAANKLTVDFTL